MKLSTLDLINNQLKDEGKKFTLVAYRNKYQIRGTFRFSNGKKKRAYISLDVPAEELSLREAKKRCDMIFYRYEDLGFIPDVLPFEKVVEPKEGMLLIFDSRISHYTGKNVSGKDRYSISGNFNTRSKNEN